MNRNFAGKVTLSTPAGTFWSYDETDRRIALKAASPPQAAQLFNLYGGATVWIQAANCDYMTFDAVLGTYAATRKRNTPPTDFTVEDAGNGQIRLIEEAGQDRFYVAAEGSNLGRIAITAPAPDSTLFVPKEIAPGLKQIQQTQVAFDANLTGAYLAKADLTLVNFTRADLTGADLSDAILKGANFSAATLVETSLRRCSLPDVKFNGANASSAYFDDAELFSDTHFSGATLDKASLVRVKAVSPPTLNGISAIEAVFNGAQLRNVPMSAATLTRATFIDVDLQGVQMARTILHGAVLTMLNARNAAIQRTEFNDAVMAGADFTGTDLSYSLFPRANLTNARFDTAIGLTGLDFSGATMIGAQLSGIDFVANGITVDKDTNFTRAIMDGVNLDGYTLNSNTFLAASLRRATLNNSSLNGAVLVDADLSFASIKGQVDMVGANLSNARLESVDMTGAQFGPLNTIGALPGAMAETLDAGGSPDLSSLVRTAGAMHVEIRQAGRSWTLSNDTQTFLAARQDDGAILLAEVDLNKDAAVLTNVFMPNAVLKEANLYAVDLSGAQWYGGAADASKTNLELANLSRANLATMNFNTAQLYGANLSFTNLVGADFTGALMTPTTGGRSASLAFASMQGANFEHAKLNAANLTNAAVALDYPDSGAMVKGTQLFDIEERFGQYLDNSFLTDELVALFAENGVRVTVGDTLVILKLGSIWMLQPSEKNDFAQYILVVPSEVNTIRVLGLVAGATQGASVPVPDITGVPLTELDAALIPDLDEGKITGAVEDAFAAVGYPLIDAAGIVPLDKGRRWAIRNIVPDEQVLQDGYGQFHLLTQKVADRMVIRLFGGSPVIVVRTAKGNTSERISVFFGATYFDQDGFGGSTVTPSGMRYELLGPYITYVELMTPGLPPTPPACIPSATKWCS